MKCEREIYSLLLLGLSEQISSDFPQAVEGVLGMSKRSRDVATSIVGAEASPVELLHTFYSTMNLQKMATAFLQAESDLGKMRTRQAREQAIECLKPNP
jgi:hypothetical protein